MVLIVAPLLFSGLVICLLVSLVCSCLAVCLADWLCGFVCSVLGVCCWHFVVVGVCFFIMVGYCDFVVCWFIVFCILICGGCFCWDGCCRRWLWVWFSWFVLVFVGFAVCFQCLSSG